MTDNPFNTPVSGQADWDSGLGVNFQALDRGYHVTERAGQAISSGQFVALNSGAFAFPWNPSSVPPCAGMAYTAAASGDSLTFLAWGIVRSLGINSVSVPGRILFSNASGFLSATTLGAPIGIGLANYGVLLNPQRTTTAGSFGGTYGGLSDVNTTGVVNGKIIAWDDTTSKWIVTAPASTSHRVQSVQIAAVTNSTHTFTMSLGAALFGWNRRVRLNGSSLSNVEIRFYRDSGRTDLQYQTLSGGISAVTSFNDRAGWPIDTDSGTIYGSCQVFSTAVGSDTLNIICDWEV